MMNSEDLSQDRNPNGIFSPKDKVSYVLTIDPGKSTGIVLGVYGEKVPYTRIQYWQVEDGTQGFCEWYEEHDGGMVDVIDHLVTLFGENGGGLKRKVSFQKVVEKFILNPGNNFTADLTPVQIEGALIAYGEEVKWHSRTDKALVKDEVLKRNDLWLTGTMVECADARDANDATIHALAHMLKLRHRPTLEHYFKPEGNKE
jgi:hypothetical protein